MMHYGYNNSFMPHYFGFGFIFNLLFWAVLIYIVYVIFSGRKGHDHHKNKALDIIKERYAKGEITKEQFESMKKDLD